MDTYPDIPFLRVCNRGVRGKINCGVCEKCIRTKLELLVLGVVDSKLFDNSILTPDLVRERVDIVDEYNACCYRDVLPGLRSLGQNDIEPEILKKLRIWKMRSYKNDVRRKVSLIDDQYLNGLLRRLFSG